MRRASGVVVVSLVVMIGALAAGPLPHARAQQPAPRTQQVAFIVRVPGIDPVTDLAGRVVLPAGEFDLLAGSVARWTKAPLADVPVALAVSPALCDQLAALDVARGHALLAALRRLARRANVFTVPYADVWLPYLPSTASVKKQLTDGRTALERCLGKRPSDVLFGHVLHAEDGEPTEDLDVQAVEGAHELGVTTVVADGVAQTAVRSDRATVVPYVSAGTLATGTDGTLREQPSDAHLAVVADAREPAQFGFVEDLVAHHGVSIVSIQEVADGAPRVSLAFPDDPDVSSASRVPVVEAGRAAAELTTITLPDNPMRTRLRAAYANVLSVASQGAEPQGAEQLASSGVRSDAVRALSSGITRFVKAELAKITLVRGSVTFTSRRGSVPVTVSTKTGYPVRVRVSVQSSKLAFPSGRTRVVTISPPGDTITFAALANSSGTFQITSAVKGASGRPKIDEVELSVRSTAANLPALILTAGGALFLLVVFGRRIGRRHRHDEGEAT